MTPRLRLWAAAVAVVVGMGAADAALAQKSGGMLKVHHRDSPGSMSVSLSNGWRFEDVRLDE